MGYYVETDSCVNKADWLVHHCDGKIVTREEAAELVRSKERAIIVVMDNRQFEAAGYAYDLDEFNAFTRPFDPRPKTFVSVSREMLKPLILGAPNL